MSRKPRAISKLQGRPRCTTCRVPELAEWVEGCIAETLRVSGVPPQAKALWAAAVQEFDGIQLPGFYTFYNHLQQHSTAWQAAHAKSEG